MVSLNGQQYTEPIFYCTLLMSSYLTVKKHSDKYQIC